MAKNKTPHKRRVYTGKLSKKKIAYAFKSQGFISTNAKTSFKKEKEKNVGKQKRKLEYSKFRELKNNSQIYTYSRRDIRNKIFFFLFRYFKWKFARGKL